MPDPSVSQSGGSLKMTEASIRDAEKALAELKEDKPGANVIRKLNAAAFVGERYGDALIADWWQMRTALEIIATDSGAEPANREHARQIVGTVGAGDEHTGWGQSDSSLSSSTSEPE